MNPTITIKAPSKVQNAECKYTDATRISLNSNGGMGGGHRIVYVSEPIDNFVPSNGEKFLDVIDVYGQRHIINFDWVDSFDEMTMIQFSYPFTTHKFDGTVETKEIENCFIYPAGREVKFSEHYFSDDAKQLW